MDGDHGISLDFSRFAYSDTATEGDGAIVRVERRVELPPNSLQPGRAGGGVKRKAASEIEEDGASSKQSGGAEREIRVLELYCSPNSAERRLTVLIVGHNPSEASWKQGHYYANPSNRMWPLLRKASLVASHFTAKHDFLCPSQHGIGFTDVMFGVCGTDSSHFTDATVRTCKPSFYARLIAHCYRVAASSGRPVSECCPKIIAFSGLRQWKMLFPATEAKRAKADPASGESNAASPFGLRPERPADWPEELRASKVFLLPSTSGAAAMTTQQREAPFMQLAALYREMHESATSSEASAADKDGLVDLTGD